MSVDQKVEVLADLRVARRVDEKDEMSVVEMVELSVVWKATLLVGVRVGMWVGE